jgi:hypothetical protein
MATVAKTLEVLRDLDRATRARVLGRLSPAELTALYAAIVEHFPADPRERLLWHLSRERQNRFIAGFSKLPVSDMSAVYLRLIAGENLDALFTDLSGAPADTRSPDKATHKPQEA